MTVRGLTLVEMCLGMAITAMTGLAIFALASVTARTWQATENGQSLDISARQAGTILSGIIEPSQALGLVDPSRPGVLIWSGDFYGGVRDGKAQLAELAVITYDPARRSILFYEADPVRTTQAVDEASEVITVDRMNRTDLFNQFLSRSWLAPPRVILGPGDSSWTGMDLTRVDSVQLFPLTQSGLPGFEMNVTLSRGQDVRKVTWIFVVRGPAMRPDYANPNG